MKEALETQEQEDSTSPWTVADRFKMLVWEYAWTVLCSWTPKPCNGWRLFWLKAFGARITGTPFVHQRTRIQIPWNLTLEDLACVGDRANLYTLGKIEIGERSIIAQEAYLCTGTHDLTREAFPLQTAGIRIGRETFVGARAFILPGITVGNKAVVGACSVVTKDVPDGAIVAGNPARVVGQRG